MHPPIHLRRVETTDLPALYEFQLDPLSNEMAGTKPRSHEVFFKAWERNFQNPRLFACVIELDTPNTPREVVGSLACFQTDDEPERNCIGYWISRPHWGKGIASRALALFLTLETRRPLHATAATSNLPSQHILTKCGFQRTGTHMGEATDRFLAREVADFTLDASPPALKAMP